MSTRITSLGSAFAWMSACLVAMIVGGFAPWATVFGFAELSGARGDGWFLIIGALLAAALLAWHVTKTPHRRWQPILIGLITLVGAIVAAVDLSDIARLADSELDVVDPGWGLFVSFVSSLSATAAAVLIAVVRPFAPVSD